MGNRPAYSTTVFLLRCLRERTPGTPPPGRRRASGSRDLRLQVGALNWSGSTSPDGCSAYSFPCLFAYLLFTEVCSLPLYICAV
jgi:hypothetical protein